MTPGSPAFLTWNVLRSIAPCGRVELLTTGRAADDERVVAEFESGESLAMSFQASETAQAFVARAIRYGKQHERCSWVSQASTVTVDGERLDWSLIANEVVAVVPGAERADVMSILAFVSEVASRRYEQTGAQTAIVYEPSHETSTHYGRLDHRLLNDYKGLLVLIRDGHAALRVAKGRLVCGILKIERAELSQTTLEFPVPPQILSLTTKSVNSMKARNGWPATWWAGEATAVDQNRLSTDDRDANRESYDHTGPTAVFIVGADGSIDIAMRGRVWFRRVNNVWRLVGVDGAYDAIRSATRRCSVLFPERIAKHFLTLALDLAVRRRGALLMLCKEPTTEVLRHFLLREGLIHTRTDMPLESHDVRTRFTQMIRGLGLSLKDLDCSPTGPLLRDISSIDGATVFSFNGRLLGFGCLVKELTSEHDRAATVREGSSTMAARTLSKAGPVLRVSTDGEVNLYLDKREWGYVF